MVRPILSAVIALALLSACSDANPLAPSESYQGSTLKCVYIPKTDEAGLVSVVKYCEPITRLSVLKGE